MKGCVVLSNVAITCSLVSMHVCLFHVQSNCLVIEEVIGGKSLLVTLPHSPKQPLKVSCIELCVKEWCCHSCFLYACPQCCQPGERGGGERERGRESGGGGESRGGGGESGGEGKLSNH